MITNSKLEDRRASEQTARREPLALADRIEMFGRAMTATQLATLLSVSRIIVYKLAKAGRIPSFRVGTCVRFDPRSVANWLRGQ